MQHARVYSILCKFVTVNKRNHPLPEVEFHPLEADGSLYPKPVIPILQSMNCDAWQVRKADAVRSAFLDGCESFMQGRYALLEAMQRAGAGADVAVLLPAFHCRSMVEPVLYLNVQSFFYSVGADLQPDFSALSLLVQESGIPIVALLLPHYFGFPNALDEAEQFCTLHGIALIEDCAHAFYGQSGGRLLGTVGSYAIASPWKFFPVRDGGILRDNSGGIKSRHNQQSWHAEAKSIVTMWQVGRRGRQHQEFPVIEPAAIYKQAELIVARNSVQVPKHGLKELVPEQVVLSSLRSSRWLVDHGTHERVAHRRRDNYLQWLEAVRGLPGVEPLFPCLPDGVVPYVFPLLVDSAGMAFHLLKLAGLPLWRWEDMAVTDCAISCDYRIRLLQLPCHQELRAEEMAWMIDAVQTLATLLVSR